MALKRARHGLMAFWWWGLSALPLLGLETYPNKCLWNQTMLRFTPSLSLSLSLFLFSLSLSQSKTLSPYFYLLSSFSSLVYLSSLNNYHSLSLFYLSSPSLCRPPSHTLHILLFLLYLFFLSVSVSLPLPLFNSVQSRHPLTQSDHK